MRVQRITALLAALVAAPACTTTPITADRWITIGEQDGVTVTARNDENPSMPVFRGVGEVNATIFEVQAVLSDVSRQSEWMSYCAASRVVMAEDDVRWVYNRISMPDPVSLFVWDRDVVVRVETVMEESGTVIESRFEQARSELVPVPERVVRTPRLRGHYRLTAISGQVTGVEYLVDADPGGDLPDWVKRRAARELPMKTILGLRAQVERTRGNYSVEALRWRTRVAARE